MHPAGRLAKSGQKVTTEFANTKDIEYLGKHELDYKVEKEIVLEEKYHRDVHISLRISVKRS